MSATPGNGAWFYCVKHRLQRRYVTGGNALIGAQRHANKTGCTVFTADLTIVRPNETFHGMPTSWQ